MNLRDKISNKVIIGIVLILVLVISIFVFSFNKDSKTDKAAADIINTFKIKNEGHTFLVKAVEKLDEKGNLVGSATITSENKKAGEKIEIDGVFSIDEEGRSVLDGYIEEITDEYTIRKEGTFIDGKLNGEGVKTQTRKEYRNKEDEENSVEKEIDEYVLLEDGVFEDDKLNGYGEKSFLKNSNYMEFEKGLFKDGKIQN